MIAGVMHDAADFVWAGSVLHCMPEEDCRAFLKSAYQLLKPGGFLYGLTAGKHESTEWTYSTDGTLKGFLYSPVQPIHTRTLYTRMGQWDYNVASVSMQQQTGCTLHYFPQAHALFTHLVLQHHGVAQFYMLCSHDFLSAHLYTCSLLPRPCPCPCCVFIFCTPYPFSFIFVCFMHLLCASTPLISQFSMVLP